MATDWVVYIPAHPGAAIPDRCPIGAVSRRPAPRELSAMGRPVLYARIPVRGDEGRDGVTIRVEYEANLLVPAGPTRARDQGTTTCRSAPTEGASAGTRGRPSVRLPFPELSRLARRPQAPSRAERGRGRLRPSRLPGDQGRVQGRPRCRSVPAGLARLRGGQVGRLRAVDRLRLRSPRQRHPRAARVRPLGARTRARAEGKRGRRAPGQGRVLRDGRRLGPGRCRLRHPPRRVARRPGVLRGR